MAGNLPSANMNPIQTKTKIEERLRNYARQSIPIERAHPDYTEKLNSFFGREETALLQQPYLELLPRYKQGETLADLRDQGVIHSVTAEIFADYFGRSGRPQDITLHSHQAEAIRHARDNHNLVVCSGTGSGKTESFLIPIIDHLVREWDNETGGDRQVQLSGGVRAMILYPMNALVNDQLARIRRILKNYDFLTMGRYTGETETTTDINDEAEGKLREINKAFQKVTIKSGAGVDGILRNEVVSRKQWQDAPAHILITNFSMLEYLLIRPETNFLFSGVQGSKWKHIVIDEAHSYDGAMGAEIGWLMRRLHSRLANQQNLRFFATSATLINDSGISENEKAVRIRTKFASRLFPAAADTFQVLFGAERERAPGIETRARQAGFYHQIASLTLDDLLKQLIEKALQGEDANILQSEEDRKRLRKILGAEEDWMGLLDLSIGTKSAGEWCSKTLALLQTSLPERRDHPVPLGTALAVAQTAFAVLQSGLAPQALKKTYLEKGFFADERNEQAFQAIALLLFYGVGEFSDTNAWRHKMHDYADPRGSWLPNDLDDEDQRQKIGNKLHFLWLEWLSAFGADTYTGDFDTQNIGTQTFENLSLDGAFWMLHITHQTAVSIDQELNHQDCELRPERLQVWFAADAFKTLTELRDWLQKLSLKIGAAEKTLSDAWREAGAKLGLELPAQDLADRPSEILEFWLNADEKLDKLQSILKTALHTPENATQARWAEVRNALFGQNAQAEQELADLIRLTSFAQKKGSREPLLDLRYHQLFRGLNGAGVKFFAMGDSGPADWILTQKTEETGELGACRNCGQTFLFAYSEKREATVLDGDQEERQLLQFAGGRYSWLWALAWKKGNRAEEEGEECEDESKNIWFHADEFKIRKTPSSPGSGWMKVVWLKHPTNADFPNFLDKCPNCGESRKPDSRTTKATYGLITPYELTSIMRVVALDELSRQADPSRDPVARCFPGEGRKLIAFSDSRGGAAGLALSLQNFWLGCALAKLLPEIAASSSNTPVGSLTFDHFCGELAKKFEDNQASRVLEMNGKADKDLSPSDAAGVLILDALRRVGRNSTVRKAGLGLGLNGLKLNGMTLDSEVMRGLLSEILLGLYKKARVRIEGTQWTDELVNTLTEWGASRKPIFKKNAPQTGINFVTGDTGEFNKLLSKALLETDCWHPGVSQALSFGYQGDTSVNSFYQRAHGLGIDDLRCLLVGARFIAQDDHKTWMGLLTQLGFQVAGSTQVKRKKFKTEIRNLIITFAEELLAKLWIRLTPPPIAPPETFGLRPMAAGAQDNGGFLLNTNPLQLLTIKPRNQHPEAYELEFWNQSTRDLIFVRVEEHTAQLASAAGAAYQRAFTEGRINVLSCSTTFEMGVDLGDLSMVFLANLPPSPSNYRQRAGRAGRRPGSPAYVMTYFGDAQHDRYYWSKPAELFFGRLTEPTIHLDNTVIRSRHLRAEALHYFLKSFRPPHRTRLHPPANGTPCNYERGWQLVQDFILGEVSGGAMKRNQPGYVPGIVYKGKMAASLVQEHLLNWCTTRKDELQKHVLSIQDVPQNLDYDVAKDFVWQIRKLSDEERTQFAPFPLTPENQTRYQKLGGPNVPEFTSAGTLLADSDTARRWRWTCLENQARYIFTHRAEKAPYYPTDPGGVVLKYAQRNFLKQKTIDWLGANRVLPKYGFPVDVAEMMPDIRDSYARRVALERDLKIGLYEYAYGEEVIADKRIYPSLGPGNYSVPGGGQLQIVAETVCDSCNEIHKNINLQNTCPICGGALRQENFCNPDYFSADTSRSGRMRQKTASARNHLYSGGASNELPVSGTNLTTAESVSGFITYLNRGPGGGGYRSSQGFYTLRHEVRTDIALWIPNTAVYQQVTGWNQPLPVAAGRRQDTRFQAAMKSALHAILRAVVLVKRIKGDDVAGLVTPDPINRQIGKYGFVLFDNSSGGAGSVQDLVLTGHPSHDEDLRKDMILRVLKEAIGICHCGSCGSNSGIDSTLPPIPREDYLALLPNEKSKYRVRVACYDCLKSYSNQREHEVLDRHDAKRILELLIQSQQQSSNGVMLRSDSKIPEGKVYVKAHIHSGLLEGECRILPWTIEGKKKGIRIKMLNPISEEISITDEDLDSGKVSTF